MKLYSDDSSPFCAPVRLALYAKGLDIPIEPPPGGMKSDEYRRLSLTGTIPCLILDDGSPLPESTVILDYLEDRFPHPPLKPDTPEARAKMMLIQRLAENDLSIPAVQLFHDLRSGEGDGGRARALARFERGLGLIQTLMSPVGLIAGPEITTADCILAPALMGLGMFGPIVGRPTLLADHPALAAYSARSLEHPAVARVIGEMQAALASSGVTLG